VLPRCLCRPLTRRLAHFHPHPLTAGYAAKGDSGQLAQFISNSSFVLLSLIYTFTELLDLSDQVCVGCLAVYSIHSAAASAGERNGDNPLIHWKHGGCLVCSATLDASRSDMPPPSAPSCRAWAA